MTTIQITTELYSIRNFVAQMENPQTDAITKRIDVLIKQIKDDAWKAMTGDLHKGEH